MWSLALPFEVIILLLMLFQMALPSLQRPDNLFSVTIAPESRRHPEAQALITRWRTSNAVLGLVAAGACAATGLLPRSASLFILPPLLLAYVLVTLALYATFHRQATAFALPCEGVATRVATLRPRHPGMLTPLWWEVLPLSVIALTVLLLAQRYPTASTVIPVHFVMGQADRFTTKSIWTFFSPVGGQLVLWLILTFLGISLSRSRVAPSTGAAGEAYRQMRARLIFAFKTGSVIILSLTILLTTGQNSSGAMAGLTAALMLGWDIVIIALGLLLALRYGQSGWRQQRRAGAWLSPRGDATPDNAWIGGVFYYNPDDPALFVDKRSGIGQSLNWGHPQARLILLGLLLVILVPLLLSALTQQ
ncbi:MAG TPA: DUF5808 domain-containing protein [Ktedonobacterales bacterium]|nr:DUF5808 domain-containing protein [Ktedonobacterales bacterium]